MPLANERAKLFRDLLLQDQGLEKTKQNKTKQKQFQQKKKMQIRSANCKPHQTQLVPDG